MKRALIGTALLAATLLLPAAVMQAADDDPLTTAAGGLVADLLKQASGLRGKSVAVEELPGPEGRPTALSLKISEALENALVAPAQVRALKLVDRRNLETLAKEWELDARGYIEEESAKQAGKLLGVDVFVIGKYSFPEKKKLAVRVTLVESESGQILAAASSELDADKRLRAAHEELLPTAMPAEPAAPKDIKGPEPLQVKVWTDKAEYGQGEKFRVRAQANQDCYLTLIDVGTSGATAVIFPNHYAPGNAVKSGVTYTVPDPAAGFDFEVSGPAGQEIVRAIASKEPSVDLSDALGQVSAESPFAELKKDLPGLTRDIHIKAKKAKPGEWSEAVLRLRIR